MGMWCGIAFDFNMFVHTIMKITKRYFSLNYSIYFIFPKLPPPLQVLNHMLSWLFNLNYRIKNKYL